MDRRLARVLAVLTAATLLAALATVPANGAEPLTRSTVSDASTGAAAPDGAARSSTALRLIDPGVAGAGFSAQPACNWGPGRPAGSGAPAMCVHADQPPAGVDVTEPVSTAELLARPGARIAATLAGQQLAGQRLAGQRLAGTAVPNVTTPAAPNVQCYGSGSDGNRVQAMYVVEQGRTNRFSSVVGSIRTWAAGVDTIVNRSAAITGGTRHLRFVTSPAGGSCTPTVLSVVLPAGSTADFDAMMTALDARGFRSPNRKYLIWTDAAVLCGIASVYQDSIPGATNYNNGLAPQYARIDTGCWGYAESVEAHELVHTLGSVQPDAPHHTNYGHCYDEYDRMCYDDGSGITMQSACSAAWDALLDCGGDDYFSTAPAGGSYLATHWNTAASGFLSGIGSLRVTGSASTLVPGLPGTVTAAVTVPTGRRLSSLTFRTTATGCTVTKTGSRQARLLCGAATGTAPAVRVTAVDNTGQSATTTLTPTLALVARPATLALTLGGEVPGAGDWCAGTGTLRARLVDDATGVPVSGLTTRFARSASAGGAQTTLGQAVSRSTAGAVLRIPLTSIFLHASTPGVGPWSAATTVTSQALSIVPCQARLASVMSRSAVGYGDRVLVSGTLHGDADGHLVPLPGRTVTVTLRTATGTRTLGRTTVSDAGSWRLGLTATAAGSVGAAVAAGTGVGPDTAPVRRLGVASWTTTTRFTAVRNRGSHSGSSGTRKYRITGQVLRARQSGVGVGRSRIEVWYAAPGRRPRRISSLVTGSTGRFSLTTRVRVRGGVRIMVKPATGYLGSRSKPIRLR